MKCIKRSIALLLMLSVILTIFGGCDFGDTDSGEADTVLGNGSSVLRIISGSENAELEPILEEFAKQENIRIEMTYQGSLDIMRLLGAEEIPYLGTDKRGYRDDVPDTYGLVLSCVYCAG